MGTLSQRQQPARQFAFRQRREFIEDREDEHRRKIGHNDGEEEEDQRGPQPPCLWLGCHQSRSATSRPVQRMKRIATAAMPMLTRLSCRRIRAYSRAFCCRSGSISTCCGCLISVSMCVLSWCRSSYS